MNFSNFLSVVLLFGFAISTLVIFVHFTVYFFIAEKKNNYGIIDVGWGQGFVFIAWALILFQTQALGVNSTPLGFLTVLFTTIWGVRLSYHIGRRNKGKPEDYRYVAMRAKIEPPFRKLKGFVKIFLVQALFMFLISIVIVFNVNSGINQDGWLSIPLVAGVILWMLGFYFQSVGDAQLAQFKKKPNNKGKLMMSGLWSATRHPNYFGEVLMWWGIVVMGFSNSFPIIIPIVGMISGVIVTLLLRYVSGVPLLEKRMKQHPDFPQYEKTTNVFIPWFPNKKR